MATTDLAAEIPWPSYASSVVAIDAPGAGAGHWAGAPSAIWDDGWFYLAYRLRRPVGDGRGYAVVVARSRDGVTFEQLKTITKEDIVTESLERPALVRRPDGGWRLYLSCATPGTYHWYVVAIDASSPGAFRATDQITVLAGDAHTAVKDPVVLVEGGEWHMWVCVHPLDDPAATDRMASQFAHSVDGLAWELGATVLSGRPGMWDARGTRITSVVPGPDGFAFYDGRATSSENWFERTGLARPAGAGRFEAVGTEPVAVSPHARGTLRYVSVVPLPGGGYRLYYEATRADGANDLVTQLAS